MNVLERNFFTDPGILQDPIPYYVALRDRGPEIARVDPSALSCAETSILRGLVDLPLRFEPCSSTS